MIRKAKAEDIEECVNIEYEAFREDKEVMRHDLNKQIKDEDYIFLVAELKDKVIGFITAKKHGWNKSVYIERLFVRGKFRRKRIGTKLLLEIKKISKKLKVLCIFVDTGTFHQYQVRFYTINGFRIVGFIKDYSLVEKNPEDRDAIVLCYRL